MQVMEQKLRIYFYFRINIQGTYLKFSTYQIVCHKILQKTFDISFCTCIKKESDQEKTGLKLDGCGELFLYKYIQNLINLLGERITNSLTRVEVFLHSFLCRIPHCTLLFKPLIFLILIRNPFALFRHKHHETPNEFGFSQLMAHK